MTEPEFQTPPARPGHCEHCSPVLRAVAPSGVTGSAYEQAHDVLRALRELDPIGRLALHLIYWHDRSQAQVADELSIPRVAVRSAVATGMRAVAARLAADTSGSGDRAPG